MGSLVCLGFDLFVRVRPGGCWVLSGSSFLYGCDLSVDGFMRLLCPAAAWRSTTSGCCLVVAGFVQFGLVRPCTPSGSLGSSGFCPGAPWVSLGSFWFVWFVRVRPGVRLVHSGLSALFRSALPVARLFQVRLVCLCRPRGLLGSFGFFLFVWMRPDCRCVHASASSGCGLWVTWFVLDAPCVSLGSFALVWFVRERV